MSDKNPTDSARMWHSNPPPEVVNVKSNTSYLFRDVDDACTEVSREVFEWNRHDCHQWLLAQELHRPGAAALVLNVYRVNFGGNPADFAEFVASLPNNHLWHIEYTRANLAWNIVRVSRLLDRLDGGEGLGRLDNNLGAIIEGLGSMKALSEDNGLYFLAELPPVLISWPEEHLETVQPDCPHSKLHESMFHGERHLRYRVKDLRERIIRRQSVLDAEYAARSRRSQLRHQDQEKETKLPKLNTTPVSSLYHALRYQKGGANSPNTKSHGRIIEDQSMADTHNSDAKSDSDSELSEIPDSEFERMKLDPDLTGDLSAKPGEEEGSDGEPVEVEIETTPAVRHSGRIGKQRKPNYTA